MVKVLTAVAGVALAAPGSGSTLGPSHKLTAPDVKVLVTKARTLVRAKPGFSRAVLLEADGTPASGKATTAADITRWRFVFNNQLTPRFRFRSALLFYKDGRFGRFVRLKSPFVEDENLPKPPRLTLEAAVAKLRAAGYRSGFSSVTLRRPVAERVSPEPLYIFGFGSGAPHPFVSVGATTGKVEPIS